MTRTAPKLVVMIGAAALLAACSFIYSTSGLYGGDRDDDDDASTPSIEGGADAPIGQGDGSPEDDDAGTASGAAFCPLRAEARFCDDFDQGTDIRGGWSFSKVDVGSTLAYETNQLVSPPRAIRVETTAPKVAFLKRTLPQMGATIRFEFAFRVETYGTDGIAEVASIGQTINGEYHTLVFYLRSDLIRIQDDPSILTYDITNNAIGTNEWHKAALDLTSGPMSRITFTLDEKPLVDSAVIDPRLPDAPVDLYLGGVYFFQSSTRWSLLFDNVLVR